MEPKLTQNAPSVPASVPVGKTPRSWKCWLGMFVLCWAVERWKAITAHFDSADEVTTASETFRHSRMRIDL